MHNQSFRFGWGFCSEDCAKEEHEAQRALLSKHKDRRAGISEAGLRELDAEWVTMYGLAEMGGMERLRPTLLKADVAFRLKFERCAREVEKASPIDLPEVRSFFEIEESKYQERLSQPSPSLQVNFHAAHSIFGRAYSAVSECALCAAS
mmetsp:Transcript_79/g.322  ORF Transcript_79/g.322 Transcript_79/m.322 type:complete len:149 (-) Transcript_79:1089-1535(-)